MPSGVKDIQLLELKDTISQLNKTISTQNELISSVFCKHFLDKIAKYFWTLLQNVFGHCCMSKLDKVAMPRLAA